MAEALAETGEKCLLGCLKPEPRFFCASGAGFAQVLNARQVVALSHRESHVFKKPADLASGIKLLTQAFRRRSVAAEPLLLTFTFPTIAF
jgi:hypothetical protein